MLAGALGPVGWVGAAFGVGQHQGATYGQRAEDVVHRQVEAQAGQGEHPVFGADGESRVATTAVAERKGWLTLTALNFEYSKPIISIKLKGKKKKR